MPSKIPKVWAKTNLTPSTVKILRRIAADHDTYIYKVIESTIKEKYPEYFKNEANKNMINSV